MGTRARKKNGSWGHYTWQSYSQVAERRTAIGSGLCALGVAPGAHVGLFGVNSADWMLVDLALHAYGFVAVPLYDTLGPEVVQFICGHAELSVVAVAAPLLAGLIKVLPECHTVKALVRSCLYLVCDCNLPRETTLKPRPILQPVKLGNSSCLRNRLASTLHHR